MKFERNKGGLSFDFVFDSEAEALDFSKKFNKLGFLIPLIFCFGVGIKAPHDELDHDYTGEHGNLRYIQSTRGVFSGFIKR